MAIVRQKLEIEADPTRPKEEIANIVAAFLQLWPGSELDILNAVKTEIDRSITALKKGSENNANDVSRNGE